MGVESEFDTIFDLLDARQKGYIEYDEILDFYQAFYFMPVARDQVCEAIKHVCGKEADGRCRKRQFLDLVVELERRRQVEEGSWWDFKALDTKDADRISVKEGLFLMKATHQEHFTTITWQKFLESRSHPHEDINYAEIRMWLCNWPLHGTSCGYDEVIAMGEKLDKEKKRQDMQRRKKVMNLEDDFIKAIEAQEKQQYSNKFRNEAKRKLNRWVQLGVESLLFDDGYDAFEGDGTQRNTVSVQDLMEAMEEKYDILREKLLWEATQKHVGESIWSSMRESEREEQVLKVKTKETEYRAKGDFEKITQLSVSYQLYNNTLISMMGYERLAHLKYLKQLQDKEKQMKGEGKTPDEMYQVFAEEHMQQIQGRATAGQLLIDLHKRHVSERDFVLSLLKGSQGRPLFAAEMVTEYVHYVTQQLIAAWEPAQLEYSAMAMGISERTQDLKSSCYDYDRDLHELLGLHRLHQNGASKRPDKPSGEHFPMEGRNRGIVDLQVEIMRAVLRKHIHERMMMSYMLQGKESTAWRAAANRRPTREAREQRINELRVLCSNWRQSPIEYIRAKQNAHVKMLLEGTWLYHSNKQLDIRGGHNLSLTQVSAHVMADLQQHHSRELERILLEMQHKSSKDLMAIWRREYSALNEEFLDGISAVILGTFELSFEELEIVAALEAKYDVLRDKLLMDALIKQYGEAEWKKMTEGERQRLLIKLKLEERRLRQDGKFDQAAKLLGDSIKDKEALQKLMGKNREEFQKKLQQRLMEREKRKAMGLDSDTESDTELQEEEAERGNILKDLQNRHDDELKAIMMLLRQQQNQYLSERERQELLLRLRRERRRAAKESNFDEAAILLGLAERNKANMEEKLKAERERQLKLARERIAARKKKSGQVGDDDFDDPSLPPKGDLEAWRDAVLREMDRKHRAEQELLVTIVMDEGSEDVRDAARKMGKEGRQQRLLYLRSKAEGLNLDKKEEKEENRDILEEAGAIKSILRHRTLQEQLKEGQEVEQEEVTTTLLADLQEEQEKESEVIMATIFTMNEEQLSRLRMDQIWSRHNEQGSNALVVLTQYEGVGDEDSLLKALDKKYDTLREKILKAALIKRVGEEKWEQMSEEEQHKMLYELKQQERRLRVEGKTSEISQQLGIPVTSEGLKKLMGTERTEYEEKRRQKMELRKRRISQGLDPIQEGDDEGISEDEEDDGEVDVLTEIQKRQDAEREALIAQLRGVEAQYLNERERQAELARLKREVRKARMEDGFHAAALVLGLAERHQAAADERLKEDRRRQEQLAKERLEAARKKKKLGTIQEEEELGVVDNGDKAAMQDAVLKMLEIKHEKERAALLHLLQHEFSEEEKFIAENLMNEARAEKQQEIWNQRKQLDLNNKEEHFKLLLEAAMLKLVSRRKLLQSTSSEVTSDEVIVSIMADLQLHQDKESETIIQTLPDKELGALKKLQKDSLEAIRMEKHENVAVVITSTDLGTRADESQLVEALEAKYDALKDKLLADALMKQMGEGEWARLSERERQLRLMKLKLEERRLRQEGKMDEAAALLGDALKSQGALEALMGESKKAQEEKLRLRLEKRKQRLAEGMSEEDVDRLEEEEIKQEEEELKKQRKNILLDLDNRLEDEKAALLAALRGQSDRLQSEKERQAELARLRREQRRARHEDKFEAAALVMGLAQKADDAKEQDRKRQEQLAKERLEQRRRLKAAANENKETVTPVMLPENENDKQALQEAVIQEMEMKHTTERDFLMQLVQDENQGDLRKSASLMSEDKRQQRLGELKEQRRQWRESGPTKETEDEQTDILRKGVAVLLESRLLEMKTSKGEEVTDGDVEVSLIADLQEKQDKEASYLMDDLESKSAMTLKQLKQVQFIARANGWNDNVAATVLVTKADTEMVTEEQLLKALENKYDVMRDKLMAEALIKQTGEAEWAKLSERERQARLMKLKLQERKMRQENKFDEANSLLSQGIKDQAELARLLGATKTEQEEKLKQRLERKKQLKEEREAQGLEANDEVLDEIVQHEMSRKEVLEERKKRHNILEGLNNHFEDEKNALLAALRGQDDSLRGEKERQLALAKLRRDQRKLQDEEKFEAAAALFGLAQQHEKAREANYEKDKERQKQLARERLAARRAKMAADKKGGRMEHLTRSEIQEQLLLEEKENAKADAAHATKTDPLSLVSTVMDEVDKKQGNERDVLVTLVDGALANTKQRTNLQELALKDLLAQLEALKEERRQLREDADLEFGDVDVSKLSEEELSRHLTQVSEYQEQQHRLLKSAISIKIELMRRSLIQENRLSMEEIEEELAVVMLSELQQKQTVETNAVHHVLEGFPGGSSRTQGPPGHGGGLDKRHSLASIASGVGHASKELFFSETTQVTKNDEFLHQMKFTQRRARREGWLDNVAVTVFDHTTVTLEMTTEIEEMTRRIQAREAALLTMDKELEEKKASIRKNKSGRTAEELDAMIAKLEKEYADRKKALEEEQARERRQEAEMKEVNQELEQKERDLEKLDEEMKEAIENERKRRPSEAYDADAMMAEIEAQFAAKKAAMQAQLEKQRRQAMEKVAARKQRQEDRHYEDEMAVALIHAAEKNKTQKEEAALEQKNKQNQLMQDRLAARREQRRKAAEERAEAERLAQEEQKKREVSFDREKEKKKVNFGAEPAPGLIREKTVVDVDMSEDEKQHLSKMLLSHQSNAEWKLEKEREKRRNELKERLEMRKTRIQDAATTILGLGERQKTMVENKKKDERERQIAMVKERVQRVRYERTQTMKFKGEGKRQFQDYLEKEESGLTEDEKMMKIADRINSQFKRDESSYRAGHKSAFTPDEDELASNSSDSKPSTPQGRARPKTGRLLGQKERERLIKSRQAKRREIKKVNNSISAAPDMDSLAKMIEDRKKAGIEQEEDDNGSEV